MPKPASSQRLQPKRVVQFTSISAHIDLLCEQYSVCGWWPAETPFEMAVGAILVQNAAWRNAELALTALRAHALLEPSALLLTPTAQVAALIRSSGTFRVKTRRLLALCSWWIQTADSADELTTPALRASLLAVSGVGAETADCILLYAFKRPQFVADAYARRWFKRLGVPLEHQGYAAVQNLAHAQLPMTTRWLQRAHAAIVEHSKAVCMKTPQCAGCCLRDRCTYMTQFHG